MSQHHHSRNEAPADPRITNRRAIANESEETHESDGRFKRNDCLTRHQETSDSSLDNRDTHPVHTVFPTHTLTIPLIKRLKRNRLPPNVNKFNKKPKISNNVNARQERHNPLLHLGCDVLSHCLSYLNPSQVFTFLVTSPLSKKWRLTYAVQRDLWISLCVSQPFEVMIETDDDHDNDHHHTCETEYYCNSPKTMDCGYYQQLYASLVRCSRQLKEMEVFLRHNKKKESNTDDADVVSGGVSSGNASGSGSAQGVTDDDNEWGDGIPERDVVEVTSGEVGAPGKDLETKGKCSKDPYSCAIFSICNWMVAHPNVPGIQIQCLKAVCLLLEDEEQRETAISINLHDKLLDGLRRYPKSVEITVCTLEAMVILSRPMGGREGMLVMQSPSPPSPAAASSQGMSFSRDDLKLLLSAMLAFEDDARVQSVGCWSMVNLALERERRRMITTLGGYDVILGAMETHSRHENVQFRALFALINLVAVEESPGDNDEIENLNKKPFDLDECHDVLFANVARIASLTISAVVSFATNSKILQRSVIVLYNLCLNSNHIPILARVPYIQCILCWMVKKEKRDRYVRKTARTVLRRLFSNNRRLPLDGKMEGINVTCFLGEWQRERVKKMQKELSREAI